MEIDFCFDMDSLFEDQSLEVTPLMFEDVSAKSSASECDSEIPRKKKFRSSSNWTELEEKALAIITSQPARANWPLIAVQIAKMTG